VSQESAVRCSSYCL